MQNRAIFLGSVVALMVTAPAVVADDLETTSDAEVQAFHTEHLPPHDTGKPGFSGTIGAGAEFEVQRHDKHEDNESEVEYELMKLKFSHSELEDWDFKVRISREVDYEGSIGANQRSDGERGHSDNAYELGAHYQFDQHWGAAFGVEYENRTRYEKDKQDVRHETAEGSSEYTLALDYNTAFGSASEFFTEVGITHEDLHGEALDGSSMDANWYWFVSGISTELTEHTSAGFDVYYDRELGLSDNNYEYAEWEIRPFVTTELGNGKELTLAVFLAGEDDETNADDAYTDYWLGIGAELEVPLSARWSLETGLAYEHHYHTEDEMSDYYEPSGSLAVSYKF